MAVTMKDIARDVGVSVVTVSKVLRNHSDISSETRKRVLKRMKELNYQPNPAARTLVSGRTNLIGLVVPDLVHPFFAEVAKGISAKLRTEEYSLIISSTEDDSSLEGREIQQMLARRVDALILASTQRDGHSLRRIEEADVPCVLLDRKVKGVKGSFVGIDDVAAGAMATEHLLGIGCRVVAHIAGSDVSTSWDRQEGYSSTMAKKGFKLPPAYIVRRGHGDDSGDEAGFAAMQQLLQLKPRPDGIFCCNDPIAMGAMRAILEAGLSIPADIAVVGCGNVNYADFLRVPLTSIDQGSSRLGESAAKLALRMIKRKAEAPPASVVLGAELVIRASTKR